MEVICVDVVPKEYEEALLELLTLCDNDFYPPLSSRNSTTQKVLSGNGANTQKPVAYCKEIMAQKGFMALEDGKLAAIISLRANYTCDVIGSDTFPNIYLSTLAVNPAYRRRGLGKLLYHAAMDAYKHCNIYLRTWSTNTAQARIVPELGFVELDRIKDDRGAGIDTVYYVCPRQ